jgi:nicotinamide riboside kinase
VQNKRFGTITRAYGTINVLVLEHEASVAPLNLHLEMLVENHVQRTEDSAGNQAGEETRKAIDQRAQRRLRTKGNIPVRHIDQFQSRAEPIQQ